MAMIKCRICGRNISDTEKVCPYCEEKIEKMINCPKCGSEEVDFSLVAKQAFSSVRPAITDIQPANRA